jgi:hypothetical protein
MLISFDYFIRWRSQICQNVAVNSKSIADTAYLKQKYGRHDSFLAKAFIIYSEIMGYMTDKLQQDVTYGRFIAKS